MTWATTTFVTPADLAKVEEEINVMTGAGVDTYTSSALDIADATDPIAGVTSVDVSDIKGNAVIIGEAKTEITIADGETLTIKIYDSSDDSTFANVNYGLTIWERAASGSDITITAGTELFRWVVPTTCEDYIKAEITSSAINAGTLDIYVQSHWTSKISLAKQFMGEDLERMLLSSGYGDELDYSGGDELKDVITNLSIFDECNLYLTLSLIYEDLMISGNNDDQFKIKAERYSKRYHDRLNTVFALKNTSYGADGTPDTYKDNEPAVNRIIR